MTTAVLTVTVLAELARKRWVELSLILIAVGMVAGLALAASRP